MKDNNKMMHLGILKDSISKYVIVASSHEWVDRISSFLKNPVDVAHFREFKTVNGYFDNHLISVCSTGNGGESCSIAVEELYQCGARYLLRVGTTNTLKKGFGNKIILIQGVTNNDGVSQQYLPSEYPSLSSVNTLMKAEDICNELNKNYVIDSCLTPSCFFNIENERNDIDCCADLETGSLYACSASLGIDALSILFSVNQNQTIDIQGIDENAEKQIIEVALMTLKKIIEE